MRSKKVKRSTANLLNNYMSDKTLIIRRCSREKSLSQVTLDYKVRWSVSSKQTKHELMCVGFALLMIGCTTRSPHDVAKARPADQTK